MKTTVGVYNSHEEAVTAIKELTNNGFDQKDLSIIGKVNNKEATLETEEEEDTKMMNVAGTEVGVGALAGTTLGILTGVGLLAIPGLGFLYGAGALAGAIAGFDIGLIGGGILSALTIPGMQTDAAKEYETHVQEGKFLVLAQGSAEEVQRAHDILHSHGTHAVLDTH